MLDTVRNHLRTIYDTYCGKLSNILDIFIEQFGEENVDSSIVTFEMLVESLQKETLGSLGISRFSDSNEYGTYNIDRDDYEANGRGKPFLDYVPDLGILDYITPKIKSKLGIGSRVTWTITVHFPRVRVTNEYDKFIDIQDLYVKVLVTQTGTLYESFQMTRTTFPYMHFRAGYAHSHLPSIDRDSAGRWEHPCTGSGPIVQTQNSLRSNYNLDLWGLFVFELSKYVTIESISGHPFIRLESVGRGDMTSTNNYYYKEDCFPTQLMHMFNIFIMYCAEENIFTFKYVNGEYGIAESPLNINIKLSRVFITWYNTKSNSIAYIPSIDMLKNTYSILIECIIHNGNVYNLLSSNNRNLDAANRVNGKELFTFKGKKVKLNIIMEEGMDLKNKSLLLSSDWCSYIMTKVLLIVNYKYGKREIGSKDPKDQTKVSEKYYFF